MPSEQKQRRTSSPRAPKPYEVFTAKDSELVIGLVGPLGTDNHKVRDFLMERLRAYSYEPRLVRLSTTVIPALAPANLEGISEYDRANKLIDQGNRIRKMSRNNAVLAIASAWAIAKLRPDPRGEIKRIAYVITTLKRPEEVAELRKIYGNGFYLFGVHTEGSRRVETLMARGNGMTRWEAEKLVERDEHEAGEYGQDTRGTFHLSDFFIADENNDDKLRHSINRCLDVVFGHPHLTPTFGEFAMFMAFASALHSADLSRQVGAVISRGNEILSTGANDCPTPGGGLYWPMFLGDRIDDHPRGRDYKRGFDSNAIEKEELIQDIAALFPPAFQSRAKKFLRKSPIRDITEYGRVVHAEMEALLACARSHVSSVGATLHCTTFPCHNCAKHIIAAGIEQVIYVEPYPKSKAFKFHDDSITSGKVEPPDRKVRFKPFIGIGSRLFFDLFSMSMSAGRVIERKDKKGFAVSWSPASASPRIPILPFAYRPFETAARRYLNELLTAGF
jgi:deoxycytidylate deaminase